jgi:hypothetical protein
MQDGCSEEQSVGKGLVDGEQAQLVHDTALPILQ